MNLSVASWSEDAARMLSASCSKSAVSGPEDYRQLLERDPSAVLYRLDDGDGAAIGFFILRVEQFSGGSEGVILAAAARAPGVDLVELLLPAFERLLGDVSSFRVTTFRPGLIRKLKNRGWTQTHVVMRKAAK